MKRKKKHAQLQGSVRGYIREISVAMFLQIQTDRKSSIKPLPLSQISPFPLIRFPFSVEESRPSPNHSSLTNDRLYQSITTSCGLQLSPGWFIY